MSQSELGEAIGVTFQQVQKYEKGTNPVGSGRIVLVAQALQIPSRRCSKACRARTERAERLTRRSLTSSRIGDACGSRKRSP